MATLIDLFVQNKVSSLILRHTADENQQKKKKKQRIEKHLK